MTFSLNPSSTPRRIALLLVVLVVAGALAVLALASVPGVALAVTFKAACSGRRAMCRR